MYDVVVVGAGPAGSAAARCATGAGLRVLLVDRAPFPRPKTCGDALSPRAVAAVARMGVGSLPGRRVGGMRVIHTGAGQSRYEEFRLDSMPFPGVVVDRQTLDQLLLEQALAAGADFEVGQVLGVVWRDNRVRGVMLERAGGGGCVEVAARVTIAAMGSAVSPSVLGTAGPGPPPIWGTAARTYLNLHGPAGDELEIYVPIMHRGRVLSGYGWIFPAGPRHVNVGIGVLRASGRGSIPVRALLEEFIARRAQCDRRFADAVRCTPISAAPIRIGPNLTGHPGLLLAGDLAGIANPFTAEGIGPAIESGELAAQAAVGAGDEATSYSRLLRHGFPRHFRLRRSIAQIHSTPFLILGRARDLLMEPHRSGGEALRRLVWDEPVRLAPEHDIRVNAIRDAIGAVRTDVIRAARQMRPMLGELVAYLAEEPHIGFGWYAAFGASVRSGVAPDEPQLSRPLRKALCVLELVNLVTALHADMPAASVAGTGPRGTWGRSTLNLALADSLTAFALQTIYAMKPHHGRRLGYAVAETLYQLAAREHGDGNVRLPIAALFLVASEASVWGTDPPRVPGAVRTVANCLASLKAGTTEASLIRLARRRITCVREPLRGSLEMVLDWGLQRQVVAGRAADIVESTYPGRCAGAA